MTVAGLGNSGAGFSVFGGPWAVQGLYGLVERLVVLRAESFRVITPEPRSSNQSSHDGFTQKVDTFSVLTTEA